MDAVQIARDNHAIFYIVPMVLLEPDFRRAVMDSIDTPALYPFDRSGYSGYISVDASNIKRNYSDGGFLDDLRNRLLSKVVEEFPRNPSGDMNTDVDIIVAIWKFTFKITQYERNRENGYVPVTDPLPLPEGERLGRFIELKITINDGDGRRTVP